MDPPASASLPPAWAAAADHHRRLAGRHLRELLSEPGRTEYLSCDVAGVHADFTKQRATRETLGHLVELARASQLEARIEAMFAGEPVNSTEGRPALHVALRADRGARFSVDGRNVVPFVHETLDRMASLAEEVRAGTRSGATGQPIKAVVNLGIGGSDLGPAMATQALRGRVDPARAHRFVSNVDGADLHWALADIDPATTLFVVVSKSFKTTETLTNARSARRWIATALGEDAVAQHFVAVTAAPREAAAFGVEARNTFEMWDWVGGRFSVTSAAGLSLMIAVGPEAFGEFLAGFRRVDTHFREAPLAENVPVLMGLLGIWNIDFAGAATHAVIPYAQELARLPAYLQQLEMESNGKSVTHDGSPVAVPTAPVVWGESGTNGQHAFFQLLHQGTAVVPVDFIGVVHPDHPLGEHHDLLMANLFAQAEALALGRGAQELRDAGAPGHLLPHKAFGGDRPSTTLLLERLDPAGLGALIALYEHKVMVQAALWDVNAFDQWGVELGKVLAERIAGELAADAPLEPGAHDPSTTALIDRYRRTR